MEFLVHNPANPSKDTVLNETDTRQWISEWKKAEAAAIRETKQPTKIPGQALTARAAWQEVALGEPRVINSGLCMEEAILQNAPKHSRHTLMDPLMDLRAGTPAAAHIERHRKQVVRTGGYWNKHDNPIWYELPFASPKTYATTERTYDVKWVASAYNPATKKVEHVTWEEYTDGRDARKKWGKTTNGWTWLRHMQCVEENQQRRATQRPTRRATQRTDSGRLETCVQGLDPSHYKIPNDIAMGLEAAKIMVIVFKADGDTGEVTPAECAPLDAPHILQHNTLRNSLYGSLEEGSHRVLHKDGQRIEAGWTISVVEYTEDHYNAVHSFQLKMPRRLTHPSTRTRSSTATMRVATRSVRTPAQRRLWEVVSGVLDGEHPAACGIYWAKKDAFELPATDDAPSDEEADSSSDDDDEDDPDDADGGDSEDGEDDDNDDDADGGSDGNNDEERDREADGQSDENDDKDDDSYGDSDSKNSKTKEGGDAGKPTNPITNYFKPREDSAGAEHERENERTEVKQAVCEMVDKVEAAEMMADENARNARVKGDTAMYPGLSGVESTVTVTDICGEKTAVQFRNGQQLTVPTNELRDRVVGTAAAARNLHAKLARMGWQEMAEVQDTVQLPEDSDTYTMAIGAHLLPTATVAELEAWATATRATLGIGPGVLSIADHRKVQRHTRCTTTVVDTRDGFSVGHMEISSRPEGVPPDKEEYALLLRTASARYRPFPKRGVRNKRDLAKVAKRYRLHWAPDAGRMDVWVPPHAKRGAAKARAKAREETVTRWDPVTEAERFLNRSLPPQGAGHGMRTAAPRDPELDAIAMVVTSLVTSVVESVEDHGLQAVQSVVESVVHAVVAGAGTRNGADSSVDTVTERQRDKVTCTHCGSRMYPAGLRSHQKSAFCVVPTLKEDAPVEVIAKAIAENEDRGEGGKLATTTNAHNRVKQLTNRVLGLALERANSVNTGERSGQPDANSTRELTEQPRKTGKVKPGNMKPKVGKKVRKPRRPIDMHERLSLVTWNMAQPSKTQIQLLDLLGHDIVFLPEIWSKGQELQGYMGPNRLLATTPRAADPAGAVAFRLSEDMAARLLTWESCPGEPHRTLCLKFPLHNGKILVIVGVYAPPDYRTGPSQVEVLKAVEQYVTSHRTPKHIFIVLGDFNAQLIRNQKGQTGKFCLRENQDAMTAQKARASRRLHEFLRDTALYAISTDEHKFSGKKRGRAATWRRPGVGTDGRAKFVQLDYTFGCKQATKLVVTIKNDWGATPLRWSADKHDHAMQITALRFPFTHEVMKQKKQASTRPTAKMYRDKDKARQLEAAVRASLEEMGAENMENALTAAIAQAEAGTPIGRDEVQQLLNRSYEVTTEALRDGHLKVASTIELVDGKVEEEGAQKTAVPTAVNRRGFVEWVISEHTIRLCDAKEQHRLSMPDRKLTKLDKRWHDKGIKASTCNDGKGWVNEQIGQLRQMKYGDDPRAWHQWWKRILRRGRSPNPVPGRLFSGHSPQQDADEWAEYMRQLRSWKEPTEWDPLPDTYGTDDPDTPLTTEIIEHVIDHVTKEDKMPGRDGVPVTLWKRSGTARQILVKIIKTIWLYEIPPEKAMEMVHIMAHKPGRTWNERKSFRPITCLNDIMKVFDGCLYHIMARRTGTIADPEWLKSHGIEQPYTEQLPQTQRAFCPRRSSLDVLLNHTLTQWRAQACNLYMITAQTDLAGAFDTALFTGMDRALGEWKAPSADGQDPRRTDRALGERTGPSTDRPLGVPPKHRKLVRMVYSRAVCMVKVRTSGGVEAHSAPYRPERGGCQGSCLMPWTFIMLTQYAYCRNDTGRRLIYGPAERGISVDTRCSMCRKRYERRLVHVQDGHCRGCQIIRQKAPKHAGVSSHKLRESTKQIEEAFDEYDKDRDNMLNETELEVMISQTRPALERVAAAELVEQIWETYSLTDEETATRGVPRAAMYEIWKLVGGHQPDREESSSDSDDGDDAGMEAFAWRMRRKGPAANATRGADDDTDVESGGDDEDDTDQQPEFPGQLHEDDEKALDQLEEWLESIGGLPPLATASLEFADDQGQIHCIERLRGVPEERRMEHKLIARWTGRRLETFMKGVYLDAGFEVELAKTYCMWTTQPVTRSPALQETEIEQLGLKFRCDGCGRHEASIATKEGHSKHCPYIQCAEEWTNPADEHGEWEVIDVLDVRGPPEQRYWKLLWKPYPGQDKMEAERSEQDDGSWRHDWQPARNCTRLLAMQRTFFTNNQQLVPTASIEGRAWWAEKEVIVPQPRCRHCNHMANSQSAQKKHDAECIYVPVQRSKDSPAGRKAMRKRLDDDVKQYPAIHVHAPTHKKAVKGYVKLQTVSSMVSLGHLTTSDASTAADMNARMGKASRDFVKGMHLWTHPDIKRKEKLRMFRRHIMQLLYGASVSWYLTDALERRLNYWTAGKMAIICDTDSKTECGKRRVHTVMMIRYYRRRLGGNIIRAHDDDINRAELIQHAELVRRGELPKRGGMVWDFPPYDSIEELEKAAGYDDGSPIERHGIAHAAAIESAREQWRTEDRELWTQYGGDSDDESGSEDGKDEDKTLEDKEDSEKEKQTAIDQLNATTARQIQEVIEETRLAIGKATSVKPSTAVNGVYRAKQHESAFVMVTYHDGGFTPAKDSKTKEETAGWGYQLELMIVHRNPSRDRVLLVRQAYGPVQLEADKSDSCGCIKRSNNTAELSAVPQILVDAITWKVRAEASGKVATGQWITVVLVYDSKYVRDQCDVHEAETLPDKNSTVIKLCRRLLTAAGEHCIRVQWVKVKGHGGDKGNDAADNTATWAQAGGYQNVQNIKRAVECMKKGTWEELETVPAPYDADYRSTGFEPDDVRPTPEAAKPQQRRMQDERPRLRFKGEPNWLLWRTAEQREKAIRDAAAYESWEYQERQQQLQQERQEKEARRRRAGVQREQWRHNHWELLQNELRAIERNDEIDYEGEGTDETGRRERERHEIQKQQHATGFFQALKTPFLKKYGKDTAKDPLWPIAKEALCELCGVRMPSENILGHQGTELCRSMEELKNSDRRRIRTQTQRLNADHHTYAQQCNAAALSLAKHAPYLEWKRAEDSREGKGLYAKKDLEPGYRIMYYGQYYTSATALLRRFPERNRQYIVVRSLHGTRVDGEAIGQQYATKVNHREDSHANAALGWSDEIEYGIHGQPYIELTRRVAKGEQITADYGEWFDYAQHIDPIRVGEHREEDDTLEMGETEKRLSFGEATESPSADDKDPVWNNSPV